VTQPDQEEYQPQDLSLVNRMIRVFTSPSETFEAVSLRHGWLDWFVPTLLVAVVSLGAIQMAMPFILQAQQDAMEERMAQNPNITPEQREAMSSMGGITGTITLVMVPLMIFIMLFLAALIFLLVSKFILGGDVTYGQMLAVAGYSYLIIILQAIVMTPLRLAKETMLMTFGPGILLSEEMLDTFFGKLLNAVDIFVLWQTCVAAIGLAILSRASTQKAVVTLLVLWLIWILIMSQVSSFA
jgi:hypothetical protein